MDVISESFFARKYGVKEVFSLTGDAEEDGDVFDGVSDDALILDGNGSGVVWGGDELKENYKHFSGSEFAGPYYILGAKTKRKDGELYYRNGSRWLPVADIGL